MIFFFSFETSFDLYYVFYCVISSVLSNVQFISATFFSSFHPWDYNYFCFCLFIIFLRVELSLTDFFNSYFFDSSEIFTYSDPKNLGSRGSSKNYWNGFFPKLWFIYIYSFGFERKEKLLRWVLVFVTFVFV